jgi:hypothetical protein
MKVPQMPKMWMCLALLMSNSDFVIDETTSHLTKAASCQVIGYPAFAGMTY